MTGKMKLIQKIRDYFKSDALSKIALFIIGWIILFDVIAGTFIPIAYGKGCGWFAIPNLIIDIYVIFKFVRRTKDEDSH